MITINLDSNSTASNSLPNQSMSPTPTSSSNPTISQTPIASPAVPELPWFTVVLLLLSVFSVAVIPRHGKTANLKQ
jgi:hypothetical protein